MACRRPETTRSIVIIRVVSPAIAISMMVALLILCSTAATAGYTWISTGGPSSGSVLCTAYDSTNNILYAGISGGEVYKYESGTWSHNGGPTSVRCLCFDNVNNVLYAGADNLVYWYQNGAWHYTDGPLDGTVYSLACDGAEGASGIVYASTSGSTDKVYKYSANLPGPTPGAWTRTFFPGATQVNCMTMDTVRHVLYAGASDRTVYRYDGSNWDTTLGQPGVVGGFVESLAFDQERNILYAGLGLFSSGNPNVFRNKVGEGTGWTAIGSLCAMYDIYSLALDGVNNTLYAAAYEGHVFKNCDASVGNLWIDMGLVGAAFSVNRLAYANGRNTLYSGNPDSTVYRAAIPALTSVEPPTGPQGSTIDVVLTGANTDFTTSSKAVFSGDGVTVNSTTRLSSTKVRANITINPLTYTGGRNVWVNTGGDKANRLVNGFTVTEYETLSTWYLAEGTTAWGFSTYISIQNPNSSAVSAKVTLMPKGAVNVTETISLPANSQTTLTNDHLTSKLGQKDFSTKVESTQGKPIAVDRTMEWTGPGASAPEGHSSVGVTSPATTWYLPEGSTNWGFECWLLIQNPGASEASCDVTYMVEGKGPQTVNHKVPAHSRESYSMASDIGAADASIKVVSNTPVIPERAMYRYDRREGHDSIGTITPASDYYLAEGAVGYDSNYTTYVLVQNPQNTANNVTITYLTGSGQVEGPSFAMEPNSRKTVKVNDSLPPNTDVSTSVHGSKPIIAERAMYWNSPAGEACHDSIGMSTPAMTFYLPDGQTSNGRETWTLVQNANGSPVEVTITYLTPDGKGNVSKKETIPANSRKTFNMATHSGISGRASIMVQAKAGTRPVMVERAMYWSSRAAGTDTIGGSSD